MKESGRIRRSSSLPFLIIFLISIMILPVLISAGEIFVTSSATSPLTIIVTTTGGGRPSVDGQAVAQALVTSGGSPVPDASVSFSDSYGSTFAPATVITGTDGSALTQVLFSSGNCGTDVINATVSAAGYSTAVGSSSISVACAGASQLGVQAFAEITSGTSGSSDILTGHAFYCCGLRYLQGVSITITDTIGSQFYTETAQTDQNGFYSINFTLGMVTFPTKDIITVAASSSGLTGTSSAIFVTVNPDSANNLAVKLNTILPATLSTFENQAFITSSVNNYVVAVAVVMSGGSPVSGASVSFSDSWSSSFTPSPAETNSSGVAVAQMYLSTGNTGIDTITAAASLPGHTSESGANRIYVVAGATQLGITADAQVASSTSGSTDILSGNVFYCCGRHNVQGAAITVSDTIGSQFYTETAQTDQNGFYSINFTLGVVTSPVYDYITVTTSESGYTGSSSTIFLLVSPSSPDYLTVTINRFLPVTLTTLQNQPFATYSVNDYMVVEAVVTAGGKPASGAAVRFSDAYGSTFTPSSVTTGEDGTAITQLYLSSGNSGVDYITAAATLRNHFGVSAVNQIYVVAGATQLGIAASVKNTIPAPNSLDTISGSVFYCCGRHNVAGVTITVNDSLGSLFYSEPVQSDSGGNFAVNFTLPSVTTTTYDFITVSASANGFTGTSSTLYILVTPPVSVIVQPTNTVSNQTPQPSANGQGASTSQAGSPTNSASSSSGPTGSSLAIFGIQIIKDLESYSLPFVVIVIALVLGSGFVRQRSRTFKFKEGDRVRYKNRSMVVVSSRRDKSRGKLYDLKPS